MESASPKKSKIFESDLKKSSPKKFPNITSQVDTGPDIVRPRLEWNVPFDFASLVKIKKEPRMSPAFRTVTRK